MTVSTYPTLHNLPGANYAPYTVYNVSLLFPADNRLAIQASQAVAKKHPSSSFILGSGKSEPKPHDSLYMIYTKRNQETEDKLKAKIKPIADKWEPFKVPAEGYLHGGDGMFEIKRQNTDAVRKIQREVVEAIQSIRDPEQKYAPFTPPGDARTKAWLERLPGYIRKNMEQYGYEELGKGPEGVGYSGSKNEEGLRLHTTLAKVPASEKIDLRELPPPHAFKGDAEALGIFEMGPNGTCPREIAVYPLVKKATLAFGRLLKPQAKEAVSNGANSGSRLLAQA